MKANSYTAQALADEIERGAFALFNRESHLRAADASEHVMTD